MRSEKSLSELISDPSEFKRLLYISALENNQAH